MTNLPADIEAAIADLIVHAQEAGRTTGHAHALTAIARVSLETVIAAHLRAARETKPSGA